MKSSSIVATIMLGMVSIPASAEPIRLAQTFAADVIPPYEAFTIVRSIGLSPIGRPHYDGRAYVLRAVDRGGAHMRVVVDARAARVVSVTPIQNVEPAPPYQRRYDSPPPNMQGDPRGDPRYAPPPGPPPAPNDPRYSDPRYNGPQASPEDDDDDFPGEGPDEFNDDDDDNGRTGSLPQQRQVQQPQAQQMQRQASRSFDNQALQSPAVTPPAAARSVAAQPEKTPLPRPRPQQLANADEGKSAAAPSPAASAPAQNAKSAEEKSEKPKSDIRIIEIKKPEPRI